MSILKIWRMPVIRDFETSQKFCAPTFHQISFDFLDGGECELVLFILIIKASMTPYSNETWKCFLVSLTAFRFTQQGI